MARTKLLITIFLILLVGSLFRFYKLDFQSLWVDELATLRRAQVESVQNIIHMTTTIDIHPPGIYLIYYYWLKVLPDSETNFRLLSAIAGVLAILAIFVLAMKLYSYKEGLIAALIVAVSWFPIYYSQEARPYSLLFLFSIVSSIFYWQIVKKFLLSKPVTWVNSLFYILSALVAIYLHYFGTYLIFIQGLFLFVIALRNKKYFYEWLIIYSAILILYLPWISAMFLQINSGVGTGTYSDPDIGELFSYLIYINNNNRAVFGVTIFLLIILFLNVFSASKSSFLEIVKSIKIETVFLLIWFIVPLLLIVLFTHFVKPVFSFKNMIIVYAPIPILFSRLLVKSNFKNLIKFLIISLFVSLLVFNLIFKKGYYSKPTKEQFREAVQYVISKHDANSNHDILALTYASEYFDYYFKKFNSNLRVSECIQHQNSNKTIELALSRCQSNKLWFISGHQSPDERILNFLDKNYILDYQENFIGAHAALYIRK